MHTVGDVRREPRLHDRRVRRRGVQIDGRAKRLRAREQRLVGGIIEVAALTVAVDQCADKAQFGYRTLQFGRRGVGILRRQCGEAAEPVRVRAHRFGQVIVGSPGEVDGARDVCLVLDAGVEQRQDLQIDTGGVHLLDAKRAPVVQPLVADMVVGSQPGGDDVAVTRRIPGVVLLQRDQRHGTSGCNALRLPLLNLQSIWLHEPSVGAVSAICLRA